MASSIRFQSAEYLNEKLDKRAPDTFKAIFGKPQLQVHRLLRTGTTGPAKRFEFVRNQDAGDISQIRVLEKVLVHFTFSQGTPERDLMYRCLEGKRYLANFHNSTGPLMDNSQYLMRAFARFVQRVRYIFTFLESCICVQNKVPGERVRVPTVSLVAYFLQLFRRSSRFVECFCIFRCLFTK